MYTEVHIDQFWPRLSLTMYLIKDYSTEVNQNLFTKSGALSWRRTDLWCNAGMRMSLKTRVSISASTCINFIVSRTQISIMVMRHSYNKRGQNIELCCLLSLWRVLAVPYNVFIPRSTAPYPSSYIHMWSKRRPPVCGEQTRSLFGGANVARARRKCGHGDGF
jgi:hypothetical protein